MVLLALTALMLFACVVNPFWWGGLLLIPILSGLTLIPFGFYAEPQHPRRFLIAAYILALDLIFVFLTLLQAHAEKIRGVSKSIYLWMAFSALLIAIFHSVRKRTTEFHPRAVATFNEFLLVVNFLLLVGYVIRKILMHLP